MPRIEPTDEQLRSQIEAAAAEHFSSEQIEDKIAASLLAHGRFQSKINAKELAIIMRNMVYSMFAQHKVGGRDVGLVHNIPSMKLSINNHQADIKFIVHIHKPIVAFLKFQYALVNDPVSVNRNLRLKRGSLVIAEHTRRFDFKAKAALTAINLEDLARKELANLAAIIVATLPAQLERRGAQGKFTMVELAFKDHHLELFLEGEFEKLSTN